MKNNLLIPIFFLFCITEVSAQGDQAPWPDYNQYLINSTSCEIHGVFDPSTAVPVTLTVSYQLLPAGNWVQDTVFTINQISFSFLIDSLDSDSDYSVHVDCINSAGSYLWTMQFSTDPVGINEAEKNVLNLFPNPASGQVFVSGAAINDHVIIYSVTGSVVKTITIKNELGLIPIQDLSAGIYLVQVGQEKPKKLVVQ